MRRRDFVTLLGSAAAWPLAARAQPGERVRRIGVLLPAAADDAVFQARIGAFLQELAHARAARLWMGNPRRLRAYGLFKRKALHDWTSHAADAWAYLALTLDSGGDSNFGRKLVYKQGWIA
jgi:hypothetical protein